MKQTDSTDIEKKRATGTTEAPTLTAPPDNVMAQRVAALVAILAVLVWMAPDLVSQSMSLDGVVYTNIALRLSEGHGSFWVLPYFEGEGTRFTDHPPLGIYLISLWMQLAGTAFWSEKLLAVCILLAVAGALGLLLRSTRSATPFWWAWLLLCVMPVTTHTLANGFLEGWVTVFSLAAAACAWGAWRNLWLALPFGGLVLAAALVKGPAGLFALAAPLGLWWYHGRFQRAFSIGVIALTAVMGGGALLLATSGEAQSMVQAYLRHQVWASITGERWIEHGRLYLLGHLGLNLLSAGLICIVLIRRWQPDPRIRFWMVLAVAGSLPLLISARHYTNYLLPALPFYALTLAHAGSTPRIRPVLARWLPGLVAGLTVLMLAVSVALWARPGDHARDITGAARVAEVVPQSARLAHCMDDSSLRIRAYLFRQHHRMALRMALTQPTHAQEREMWLICAQAPAHGGPGVVIKDEIRLWHLHPDQQQN